MSYINQKIILATKDILEKNLQINLLPQNKIIFVYDEESDLSKIISFGYIENLKNIKNSEIININEIDKNFLKEKLLNLSKNDLVILVQSTNFRLENFRIRISLQKLGIGCIEHNHLAYIKESQYNTYINSISYKSDFFGEISDFLKKGFDNGDTAIFFSQNTFLKANGGFEDMKQNTGNYDIENRYGTLPMGENFTEIKDFSKLNGELYIKAYPGFDFQVKFCEPFKIEIKKSIITNIINAPDDFLEIIEKIKSFENEVMVRELGFGLNSEISFDNSLSDVNAFERMLGFHISLGKKHNIYRKKFSKDIIQKYHIDIFPDISKIELDGKIIYENGKYFN